MNNDHTTIILIWTVCTIFKILDNITERYVSTHDTSEKSKQEDEYIFDKFPSKLAQVGPIRGLKIQKSPQRASAPRSISGVSGGCFLELVLAAGRPSLARARELELVELGQARLAGLTGPIGSRGRPGSGSSRPRKRKTYLNSTDRTDVCRPVRANHGHFCKFSSSRQRTLCRRRAVTHKTFFFG